MMDTMYEKQINAYFDDPEVERRLIEGASRLIAIRSVKGEPAPGMPFGEGPGRALEEALELCREMGLAAENLDGYVGTADLNSGETALHILGHVDVVGEGTGWTVTGPYEPKVADGMLYGRGAIDDKGPIVAVMLAMKAVKELGLPVTRNARLILGTDEESGSADLPHYFAGHPYAPYTFTPDAEFPVINTEKGSYRPVLTKSWPAEEALPRVTGLHGGFRFNVVSPEARAQVAGLRAADVAELCRRTAEETGTELTAEDRPGGVEILCRGVGSHAAFPWDGRNANTALLDLLDRLPLADVESTRTIRALHRCFPHGDDYGRALGVAQEDEISGVLTLVFSVVDLDETGLTARFDSRTSLNASDDNCRRVVERALGGYGIQVEGEMEPPHHTPADSPFIQTLLRAYEQYTGQKGECIAVGGGSYVHNIPGGVAFGCKMPGFEPHMHGADERIGVKDLLTAGKIFTQVIAQLCR